MPRAGVNPGRGRTYPGCACAEEASGPYDGGLQALGKDLDER